MEEKWKIGSEWKNRCLHKSDRLLSTIGNENAHSVSRSRFQCVMFETRQYSSNIEWNKNQNDLVRWKKKMIKEFENTISALTHHHSQQWLRILTCTWKKMVSQASTTTMSLNIRDHVNAQLMKWYFLTWISCTPCFRASFSFSVRVRQLNVTDRSSFNSQYHWKGNTCRFKSKCCNDY